MQVKELHDKFDTLQFKFGDSSLSAIYGAGCINQPNICFVFMNPIKSNVSAHKDWMGLRAPWIGTKNVWKLLSALGFLDKGIYLEIKQSKPSDWDTAFADKVYQSIKNNKVYITNLAKSTQSDARSLPNSIFEEYLPLLEREILLIKPKAIITFGNQVSSIILNQSIKVSECRKKSFDWKIASKNYKVHPVYYPVGQGMRNMDKAINDIQYICKIIKI
ncbi:MAG: uracil-DNA glycosylase family protein [bacterium]